MTTNVFDQFDETPSAGGNVFDQFDTAPEAPTPIAAEIRAKRKRNAFGAELPEQSELQSSAPDIPAQPAERGYVEAAGDMGTSFAERSGGAVKELGNFIKAPVAATKQAATGFYSLLANLRAKHSIAGDKGDAAARQAVADTWNQELIGATEALMEARTESKGTVRGAVGDTMAEAGKDAEKYWQEKLSPKGKALKEGFGKAKGLDSISFLYDNPEYLPQFLAGVAPDTIIGLGATKAATLPGKVAGLSDKALLPLATTAAIGTEAAQSAIGAQTQIAERIAQMPDEDFDRNADFQQLLARYNGDRQKAKEVLALAIAGRYSGVTGAATAFGSIATGGGRATAEALQSAAVTAGKAARNVGKDTGEEVVQGLGEDYAQYRAEGEVDPNAEFDPIKSAVTNAVGGFGMSAPTQAAGYAGAKLAERQDSQGSPPAQDVPADQETTAADMAGQPPAQAAAVAPPPTVDQSPDLQMQNRDRGTTASVVQMQSISNAPDFDRLNASPIADVGAPLVSVKDNAIESLPQEDAGTGGEITLPDGAKVSFRYAVVDAGQILASHDASGRANPDYGNPQPGQIVALTNGRVAGLQEAYARGTASQPGGYMDRLLEDGSKFGISPESITNKEAPVLVRVYDDSVNARPDIGRMSNSGGSMRMSAQEVARNDARILPDVGNIVVNESGDIDTPANLPFVRGFVQALPENERAEVLDRDGRLSQVGMRRIRNAIIHRAYGESSVFGRLVESMDSGMANLSKALVRAAPKVAKVKELMAAGAVRDMDITGTLVRAVAELERMRTDGISLAQFLAQARLLDQLPSGLVEVLAYLDANIRAPNRIAAFIEAYYNNLENLGDPRTADMFGAPEVGAEQMLNAAAQVANQETADGLDAIRADAGSGEATGQGDVADAGGTAGGQAAAPVPGNDGAGAGLVAGQQEPAGLGGGASEVNGTPGQAASGLAAPGGEEGRSDAAGSVADQRPLDGGEPDAGRGSDTSGSTAPSGGAPAPARDSGRAAEAVADVPSKGVSAESNTPVADEIKTKRSAGEDKYAQIARGFAENRAVLGNFKKGDKVSYVAAGTYTQDDGTKIVDPVRTGTVTKIQDKEQGIVLVDGNISIGASRLTLVDSTPENKTDRVEKALSKKAEAPPAGEAQAQEGTQNGRQEQKAPETAEVLSVQVDAAAHEAATSPKNDLPEPTPAQVDAGNYRKGHLRIGGLDISIENPAGSDRKGVDPSGKAWAVTLKSHYGYIRGTLSKDGDHVDAFIRPGISEDFSGDVFVIDQAKANGHFDEQKVMMGWGSEAESRTAYLENYEKGWDRIRSLTRVPFGDFKRWVEEGDHTQPFADFVEPTPAVAEIRKARENAQERSPEGSAERAYTKDKADQYAKRMTAQGFPSEVVPHPIEAGKYAIRPVGDVDKAETEKPAIAQEAARMRKKVSRDGTPEENSEKQPAAPVVETDRDHFTLERLSAEANTMEPVTFERGEYVRYLLSGKTEAFGEIDGISHANREFSVDGLWYPFGAAYKADRPAPSAPVDAVPLSSVIDKMNAKHGEGLGDADRIATIASHEALFDRVRAGSVTADEFKAAFESVVKSKDMIEAELSALTKDKIFDQFPGLRYRYKSEKKDRVVGAAYQAILNSFVLGDSISWSMGEKYEDVIRGYVEKTTGESLAEYADRRKTAIAEHEQAVEEAVAGMDNPESLDDYKRIMSAKAREIGEGATFRQAYMAMKPEWRAHYDALAAENSRGERSALEDVRRTAVRAAGQEMEGQITETKHTKTGEPLFVVKAAERVERDVYNEWNTTAKRLGGWYSSYRGGGAVPGFQFKTRENAEAFLKYLGGDTAQAAETIQQRRDEFSDDRSQTAVERLTEMADSLEAKADEALSRERKTNTERRARMAGNAEAAASASKAMANTMRNIASAIEGKTAKFLNRIRQKAQIEMLQGMVTTAQSEKLRALYPAYADQEKHRGEAPDDETADYADFPTYTAYRSDLASLARALSETEGTKKIGQQLLKVADDVSDAYLKFAKENLTQVSAFRGRDGSRAAFSSKPDAEAAIARSGYNGAAIVLPFKRGENLIVLSPSEAIKRGIWTGDNDKRITIAPDLGTEIVEKLGKLNRRKDAPAVPWQFESAHEKRKRLGAIGIETPAEMRAALREFIGLREAPKEADKVKQLERAMVGRKKDGLDFFPTPAAVAQEMIETADIKEGMSILEPSAGMGHIADQIRDSGFDPDVIEMSGDRRELLEAKGYSVVGSDFLDMKPRDFTYGDVFRAPDGNLGVMRGSGGMGSGRVGLDFLDENGKPDARRGGWYDRDELVGVEKRAGNSGYDRILMNPPFSDRRDAEHVQHAYSLLKPGGRLVAIMGEGVFFGSDKAATAFRDWLEAVGGTSEKLAEGTFMDPSLPVNTGVNARMVVVNKPAGDVSLPAMEDIGKVGPWNTTPGYSPIPAADLSRIKAQLLELRLAGLPKEALDRFKTITGLVSPANAMASFNPVHERLSIGRDLLGRSAKEIRNVLAHEVAHAIDFEVADGIPVAVFSSHPDMAAVVDEAQAAYASGAYPDVLWYPLDGASFRDAPDVFRRQELFAQLVALYSDDKAGLRTRLPKAFSLLERVFHDREQLRAAGHVPEPGWVSDYRIELANNGESYRLSLRPDGVRRTSARDSGGAAARSGADYRGSEESGGRADQEVASGKAGPDVGDTESLFSRAGQTDTPEFKRWFDGSKVVDAEGKPLPVYHGTASDFTAFDPLALGKNTKAKSARQGFFFAASQKVASGYGMLSGALTGGEWIREAGGGVSGANVMPVFLSIKNPMVVDYGGKDFREAGFASVIQEATAAGHDGVLFKNAEDSMHQEYSEPTDIYVAFDPAQIKSAIGNNGQFDPNDPNIVMARGAVAGIHSEDFSAVVKRARAAFPGLRINPLETESQAPEALRNDIADAGANGDVAGAMHGGEMYLFQSGLKDIEHAERTVMHEAEHAGLRQLFGADLDAVLLDIHQANLRVQLRSAKIKKQYGYSVVRSVDEALADMGAEVTKLAGWNKLIAFVRAQLRKGGFVKDWTDNDVEALVLRALEAAKRPAGTHMVKSSALSANLSREGFAQVFLQELAVEDALFRYPTSQRKDLPGVFDEVFPGVLYYGEHTQVDEKSETEADHRFVFQTPRQKLEDGTTRPGQRFWVFTTDDKRVWVNILNLQPGEQGGRIYAAVANWAHNSGYVFGGDPLGVSPAAIIARTKMMLSSALRHGTTKHLDASREQERGRPDDGIAPLNWRGSDVEKVRSLIQSYIKTVHNLAPSIKGFRYDFAKRRFIGPDGAEFHPKSSGFDAALGEGERTAARIGKDSGRAAILIQSLVSGEGGPAGDGGILQAVLDDPNSLIDGELRGVFSRVGQAATPKEQALQRVEEILRRKASGETITDKLIRIPTQMVGAEKAIRAVGRMVRSVADKTPETVKAGVVSDYAIPEDVIDRRDAMFGHQRKQLRGLGETLEQLEGLTFDQRRIAYEWLNNRDADHLLDGLPDEQRAVMEGIKQHIDEFGREAVELGLLSGDAYETHKGAYVHRSYRKWDIEQDKGERKARARSKLILGEQFKGRGLTELAPMQRVQNTNPGFWKRKAKTGKADQDLRGEEFIRFERWSKAVGSGNLFGAGGDRGKMLEVQYWPKAEPVPARYGAWHEAGTFTVRGAKGDKLVMHRDWTKSERESMGEIEDANYAIAKTFHQMIHDIEVAKYLRWVGSQYGKVEAPRGVVPIEAKEALSATFGKDDWVQVPESKVSGTDIKKYSGLAGLYIPGPIWNDIRQVVNTRYQPFGRYYANILKAWKIAKTSLSPAVHMNNVMANMVMADWHDVRAIDVAEALKIVLLQNKRPEYKELLGRFEDAGGTQGMYILSEIQREQLEPIIENLRAEVEQAGEMQGMVGASAALQALLHGRITEAYEAARGSKGGKVSAAAVRKLMDIYQGEDTVFRLAAFLKAKRNGEGDQAAGKAARRSFLDYQINAPWINVMRQTAFPFISFTYRAVPMLLKTIETKPWKIMKLGLFAGIINAIGYGMSGGDEDKERKLLAKEKAGRIWGVVPKLVRMPWNDEHGSPVFLDIRRWVPVGDVLDTGQTHAAVPWLPFAVPGGPLAITAELLANKSQFTGKELVKETDTPSESAWAVSEHLYKAFAPNIMVLPGTYAFENMWNAGTGKTDSFGREKDMTMAGLSSVGVKIAAYPSDAAAQNKRFEFLRDKSEIQRNMKRNAREVSRNGMSQEEFQEALKRDREKLQKRAKEYQETIQ